MPELKWNEYDFVECLGVLAKFDEDWIEYSFEYKTSGLVLKIFINPYESLVNIYLSQELSEEPFLKFSFLVRGEVRYINEKNSGYLEFSDCIVSNYCNPDLFDKSKYPSYSNFEIHTFPKFQLKFS
jgi:hypothetical protein